MEKIEYEWVKQTRANLLEQCKCLTEDELNREFGFGSQSIKESLFHIAGCYHAWLGSFVLSTTNKPFYSKDELTQMKLADVEPYFVKADTYVKQVFEKSLEEQNTVIEKVPSWKTTNQMVKKSPHQLLVHSITHEFHHKGQIVAMLRLLGYLPKNTDIISVTDISKG